MKFIAVILSISILVLSLAPCGDEIDCNNHIANKTEQTGDKHDHKTESCSPFCICACCSHISNIFSEKTDICKFNLILVAQAQPCSNETFISESHSNIWQPPKLS